MSCSHSFQPVKKLVGIFYDGSRSAYRPSCQLSKPRVVNWYQMRADGVVVVIETAQAKGTRACIEMPGEPSCYRAGDNFDLLKTTRRVGFPSMRVIVQSDMAVEGRIVKVTSSIRQRAGRKAVRMWE